MLSRTRAYFRGVIAVGTKVQALEDDMREIQREWEDELSEMRNMWDKLQLWAARQAKRDKAITQTHVEALTGEGNGPPDSKPLFPDQMSKAELRTYAAKLKAGATS